MQTISIRFHQALSHHYPYEVSRPGRTLWFQTEEDAQACADAWKADSAEPATIVYAPAEVCS